MILHGSVEGRIRHRAWPDIFTTRREMRELCARVRKDRARFDELKRMIMDVEKPEEWMVDNGGPTDKELVQEEPRWAGTTPRTRSASTSR